ncbi:MAG: Glu-tRNA(Gln) amidotransferase subunit GatD [Candidatus Woesearchaeota archaeon]
MQPKPGDHVEIKTKEAILKGTIIPQEGKTIVLKLPNGYNIGINPKDILKITTIKSGKKPGTILVTNLKHNPNLPKITFIATGGTIGTHVDYETGAVYMCRTPEQILTTTPELGNIVNIKTASPFTTASEDMSPENWQALATIIAKELNNGSQGIILTHGTDTLHFTSAALSFMLPNLSKPVALVGAQRSPDRGSFDGTQNLLCAAHYAKSDIAEVAIVMHATSNDDYCLANRGTKVRKMHTSRRDAFRPINALPLAKIWPDGKFEKTNPHYNIRSDNKITADTAFEKKVGILKVFVGSDPKIIDWYIENKYRGLVIEGTALGHVPTGESGTKAGYFDKKMSWIPYIKKAVDAGIVVVMASTCLYGRINPFVYRNLRLANATGMLYGDKLGTDMLPEVAYIKLGWVLGHTKNPEKAKEMMLTNYAHEISERSYGNTFLY